MTPPYDEAAAKYNFPFCCVMSISIFLIISEGNTIIQHFAFSISHFPACRTLCGYFHFKKETVFVAKTDPAAARRERRKTIRWVVTVFFATIVISGVISLVSDEIMEDSSIVVAFLILLAIVFLGIVFDIIGMAVASADEKPFHSMAARKVPGAQEAIRLLRNAERVSSICNDVVGDICGIVSGSTATVIVVLLQQSFGWRSIVVSTAVTALISGLTIGGKAIGKKVAMKKSKDVIYLTAKVLSVLHLGR